jgi:hypothetical protein
MSAEIQGVPIGPTLFEPRVFWSVKRVDVDAENADPQVVVLDRQHFFNGERYPITITEVVVSPINYARKFYADPTQAAGPAEGLDANTNILGVKVVLSARQRQSYSRRAVSLVAYGDVPTAPQAPAVIEVSGPFGIPSSFTGQVYRTFDKPLIIPRDCLIQFDLTPFDGYMPAPVQPNRVKFLVAFWERYGIFGANARQHPERPGVLADALNSGAQPFGPVITPNALAPSTQPAPSNQLWPPSSSFPGRQFRRQSYSAEGSVEFYGMGVMIDQIDYDRLNTTIIGGVANTPMAMLAQRVGCRARLPDSGTRAWWWRQGAPLALVFPTLTPALVYKLDRPITMTRGERIEVELTIPPVSQDPQGVNLPTSYEVGVALSGYAAIQG